MIEDDLYDYLTADSGVSALVGARIWPDIVPQDPSYPLITYARSNDERESTFDEGQTDHVGADFQIDSWGETRGAAIELAATVRAALLNYGGDMGATRIDQVRLSSQLDIYEHEVGAYRRTQIWTLWYYE